MFKKIAGLIELSFISTTIMIGVFFYFGTAYGWFYSAFLIVAYVWLLYRNTVVTDEIITNIFCSTLSTKRGQKFLYNEVKITTNRNKNYCLRIFDVDNKEVIEEAPYFSLSFQNGMIMITNIFFNSLSDHERGGLFQHEIGHIENNHQKKLFWVKNILGIISTLILGVSYTFIESTTSLLLISIGAVILNLGVNIGLSWICEIQADQYVIDYGTGEEIIGLTNILSSFPHFKLDYLHPSISSRVKRLKEGLVMKRLIESSDKKSN